MCGTHVVQRAASADRQAFPISSTWRFGDRRWSVGIPNVGVGLCDERPDISEAVLDRLNLASQFAEYDELVWDHAARRISSSHRIGEPHGDTPGGVMACSWRVPDILEATLVDLQGVEDPSGEEEPKPPGTPPSGPDEPLL